MTIWCHFIDWFKFETRCISLFKIQSIIIASRADKVRGYHLDRTKTTTITDHQLIVLAHAFFFCPREMR